MECCQTAARQVRLRQYQADKDQQEEMTGIDTNISQV